MIFINVKGAPGIQKAHKIWIERLKSFSQAQEIRDLDFDFKLIFCSEIVCLPVHFFWVSVLRKMLGLRTVGIFHGFANKQHYSFSKYHFLKIAQWVTWRTTFLRIYNSRMTLETLMKQFRSEMQHNDHVIYPAHSSYTYSGQAVFKRPNIVYFGRMVTSKNVHRIIQKFKDSEIKHSHRLILAGGYIDENVRSELKKLTNEDGIKYIGEYRGHLSLKDLLNQAECDSGFFISWNDQEPFGLVYQEAIELNLLPLLPVQIGFAELLDDKLVEQLTFNSLESAFSSISIISSKVNLVECKMPLDDDICKFLNYTVDYCGF